MHVLTRFLCGSAVFLALLSGASALAQCPMSSVDPSVTICQPADGATVSSPVRIVAGTTSSSPVTVVQIYVDGLKKYEAPASTVDTNLTMADGAHRVSVQAQNSAGQIFKQTINITVGAPPPPPCTLNSTDPSVTICQPSDGAIASSPVRVVAGTTSSSPVSLMQVWVDGVKQYEIAAKSIDTAIAMANGQRRIVVQARNNNNVWFKQTIFITVGSGSADLSKIKHIIYYMQENRPFDQYFGRMGQYRRDRGFTDAFDELPLTKALPDTVGHMITPYHLRTACHENLSPGWNESHYSWRGGLNDFFMKASGSVPSTIDPHGTRAMGYYDWNDLPYYYELAFQFATSDRWFSSVMAPTIPNRMYLFAGTSFGHIRPDPPPAGGWTPATFFDKLTDAGVSWKYYYHDSSVFLADWANWTRLQGKVENIANYYTDLQNGTLPSVVFLERASRLALDEHPGANPQSGAANTKKLIDALMQSTAWESSVFILTFDEGGGFYDHVPPPNAPKPDTIAPMLRTGDQPGDFDRLGFRVPFIVISPWAKPHYVSHVVRDNSSMLKLIETRFGLPPMTQRDAWADDMTEFFDFSNPYWLTPPALPAQLKSLPCDKTLQNAPGH